MLTTLLITTLLITTLLITVRCAAIPLGGPRMIEMLLQHRCRTGEYHAIDRILGPVLRLALQLALRLPVTRPTGLPWQARMDRAVASKV